MQAPKTCFKKKWIQRGTLESANFMAYMRWKSERALTPNFKYKPTIMTAFARKAIKNNFYRYYQFRHEDSPQPVGISAINTCYCPYFHKAISPNASYIDKEYRGLGFYKKMYNFIDRFIEE